MAQRTWVRNGYGTNVPIAEGGLPFGYLRPRDPAVGFHANAVSREDALESDLVKLISLRLLRFGGAWPEQSQWLHAGLQNHVHPAIQTLIDEVGN